MLYPTYHQHKAAGIQTTKIRYWSVSYASWNFQQKTLKDVKVAKNKSFHGILSIHREFLAIDEAKKDALLKA